jgi:hypothetical protein
MMYHALPFVNDCFADAMYFPLEAAAMTALPMLQKAAQNISTGFVPSFSNTRSIRTT